MLRSQRRVQYAKGFKVITTGKTGDGDVAVTSDGVW
jgi:hypothetical protein